MSKSVTVLCHNIRSLHNVGSIFRTCEALGVAKLILTGYTGTPPDPRIAKVALGAENWLSWQKYDSPLRAINLLKKKDKNLKIVCLENNVKKPLESLSLSKFHDKNPILLIIGEETIGIPLRVLKVADVILEIPMKGKKESLNVSVALGIALWQLFN